MHGELMEFNDMLHRQLNAREALIRQYKQELVELRGPVSTVNLLSCGFPSKRPLFTNKSFFARVF